MSYNIDNIINIQTRIVPSGLGFANFATAMLFAPEAELPAGFDVDAYREYNSAADMATDGFSTTSETYLAASRWLGGIPATRTLKVWGVDSTDATVTDTLNKARNALWWYWSFFTAPVYADITATTGAVELIAAWHETDGESFFMNCQTGTSAAEIRDPNDTDDIATRLTTLGYRRTHTATHATDAYEGIALAKWYAAVNYSATNSTITGEYKKLNGVAAEDLTATESSAMRQDTKNASWYGTVELKGSTDQGRVINTRTHSTYGEWLDDVVNLDAFINALKVELYNTVANSTTKIPQTPQGQKLLIAAAERICEQYIQNRYLGPRVYTDPDDGVEKEVPGYVILTQPEDILTISDSDRDDRKAAPIQIRIFRAGAVHVVDVAVDVY